MNRKEAEELLKDFNGVTKRNVESIADFLEEFQQWNYAIREAAKLQRTGKNVLPSVPPTPGASRFRRKLSIIGESPGGEGQGDSRASRISGNTRSSIKSSPKHRPKRVKLSYGEEDASETINDTTGNTVQDSQSVSSESVQGPSLKSVQGNNDVYEENEERRGGRKGRRTKQSSILGRKQAMSIRRNTRSNARITRSTTREALNDCDRDSLNLISQTTVSKSVHKNVVNKEILDQRGRRTKQSSIVRKAQRVTSTRISRSNARLTPGVNHKTSNDGRNSQNAISQTSNTKFIEENNDIEEGRVSNNDTARNHSKRTRKISEHSNDSGRKTRNSSQNAQNEIAQDSLNVLCGISETPAVIAVADNSSTVHIERLDSSAKSRKSIMSHNSQSSSDCKLLTVCLTRIDDAWCSPAVSEESLKGGAAQGDSERKKSEDTGKRSSAETRKRSHSSVHNHHPSKKSVHDKNIQDVESVHTTGNVKETSNVSQESGNHGSGRLSSSKHSKTSNKKHIKYMEIESFSEIPEPSSETMVGTENLFEELNKGDDKPHINDRAGSVKGNSDSGLEHSEYYSLVDTGEVTQDGKVEPKPFLEKNREEILDAIREQNTPTPERTIPRKGGKSPALFSAYANEPVKNRVAAYEGLSTLTEEVQVPVTNKRVTRTKTRAMAAAAAAAAAAVAPTTGASQPKAQLNNGNRKSGPSLKITRASWRIKKKIANTVKKNDASKENSFQFNSSKNTDRYYKNVSGTGSKILADINGLFSPGLNNSKKTPMTGPRTIPVYNLSASQVTKSGYRPGVILSSVETFIKKPVMKTAQDSDVKKFEEQKKREEKEKEAHRRREELLKKQAEEKKKKRDEMRLRVQEKREAQEKEKQESQLRVGKEKDEKWHILQQEREAKLKENALKKKFEAEKKAAEARRKLEEAEAARIAKLKMEELQHKKEQEEVEREKLKHIAEEKEAALLRERIEQKAKELAAKFKTTKAEVQKNTVPLLKPPVKVVKPLDTTFTATLNSTFTVQSSDIKTSQNLDNAYNLEDMESEDSNDEDEMPKHTARWALKSELLQCSRRELALGRKSCKYFCAPDNINISAIFPRKAFKRTSSAIWNTPPRYSVLPKY